MAALRPRDHEFELGDRRLSLERQLLDQGELF